MNAARRQTLLAITLPALAVVAVYVLWPRAGVASEVRAAQETLDGLRRTAPAADVVARASARLAAVEAELRAASDELARATATPDADAAAARRRAATAARLTDLLTRHRLRLVAERVGAPGGTSAPPAALVRASGGNPDAAARLRTLRVEGRFLDVLAALEELGASDAAVVPVRVTLSPDPDAAHAATWSLVLWM